jgi:hypothetical protein
MNTTTIKRWAWMGCALGGLSGSACATNGSLATSTTYGRDYTTTVASGPRWQDPSFFRGRVEERLGRIEQRVRGDIASGLLPAEAIDDFHASQSGIERYLSQAALDGTIDMSERQAVRDMVRNAAVAGHAPGAYGGGPGSAGAYGADSRPAPRSYFDDSWEWGIAVP